MDKCRQFISMEKNITSLSSVPQDNRGAFVLLVAVKCTIRNGINNDE